MSASKGSSCLERAFGCLGFLVVAIVGIAFLASIGGRFGTDRSASTPAAAPEPEPTPELLPGVEGLIHVEGGKGACLAVDDDSYEAMIGAQNARDLEELGTLMARGKVFREENGARVKVLRRSVFSVFVRVREGANPGAEGWVQSGFVKPMKNPRP